MLFLKMKLYRKGQEKRAGFKPFTKLSRRKTEKFILPPAANTRAWMCVLGHLVHRYTGLS